MTTTKPRVLLIYYTYTQQTFRAVEAMADVLRERGCEVRQARIEFIDPRYIGAVLAVSFPACLPRRPRDAAQLRRGTGQIRVPDEAREGQYDLVCIGSPTWWLTTCMPIRSFMKSDRAGRFLDRKRFAAFVVCRRYWRNNLKTVRKLGTKHGGEYINGIHFTFAGGQVRSLLSLISYLGKGEHRERYLGVRIPSANLKPDYIWRRLRSPTSSRIVSVVRSEIERAHEIERASRQWASCGTARTAHQADLGMPPHRRPVARRSSPYGSRDDRPCSDDGVTRVWR
jgi:menaquinone-dependent protoporphyrinogen IX oxidase